MPIIPLTSSDSEYSEAFRAYRNYLEDLAGIIGGTYGVAGSMVEGVHDSVFQNPPVRRIRRKSPDSDRAAALEKSLRKAWSNVHRMAGEIAGPIEFDAEANAWLPAQAYYAVYHALLAFAAASGQPTPRDHRGALNIAGRQASSGVMPFPWSACCVGGPDKSAISYSGFTGPISAVHVLTRPDPVSAQDRLAMLLRTTRQKELERRFAEERSRKLSKGRSRRNLPRARKAEMAASLGPTSIFDVLWRLRKKAHYEDADVFVLGASHDLDARRLGVSLALVTDATVAVLEALIAAHVGSHRIWDMAERYRLTRQAPANSAIGLRVDSIARYVSAPAQG